MDRPLHNSKEKSRQGLLRAFSSQDVGWPKLPWAIAEDCETLGLGFIKASKFQRKTDEFLVLEPTAQTFRFMGPLPCGGTEVCQTCGGEGQHLRFSTQWEDCETCEGTGECPCIHDDSQHRQGGAQ